MTEAIKSTKQGGMKHGKWNTTTATLRQLHSYVVSPAINY